MGRTIVSDQVKETSGAGIYDRYPDISNRDRWEKLSSSLKKDIIEAGEEAQSAPWTQLLISDFTKYSRTGERLPFEDKYFPRRKKLSALVMAECVENKGRFIDDILDGLYLILEETTWCLPAHNTYIRDAVAEYLPDASRPVIDLFDAETGAFMAMAEYLLRPHFAKVSPYISEYVNRRLDERVFKPYFNEHFWWMGNGKEPMCNWTPWITQNVLLCAFTREKEYFSEVERRAFLKKAAFSLDYFLDEYGDDGCCNEGAQYYSHAGLCLFGALDIMRYVLDEGAFEDVSSSRNGDDRNRFSEIFKVPLIRNIGNYIVKMHACGDYYINFADCSPICGRRTAREYLFGKATGDEALMSFAATDFAKGSTFERLISDEINLYYHVMQVFTYDEMVDHQGKEIPPQDCFFESTGLMIARDEHFVLAAKAGNNADSHNHNDVGSFTIYKDARPLIIDLGVETYTAKTFSDKRYEIWTMQSQFHNVPTFVDPKAIGKDSLEDNSEEIMDLMGKDSAEDVYNPGIIMQKDGAEHCAKDVTCSLCGSFDPIDDNSAATSNRKDSDNCTITMDISEAYGDSRLKSYVRTITLKKGDGINVKDEYSGELPAILSLMSYEKPEIIGVEDYGNENDKLGQPTMTLKIGELGICTIVGAESAEIQSFPISDERLSIAWKHELYRILIKTAQGSPAISIDIQ